MTGSANWSTSGNWNNYAADDINFFPGGQTGSIPGQGSNGDVVYFNTPGSAGLNVNVDVPVNLEALNFTGTAFSGTTGYTLSSNNGNGITILQNQHAYDQQPSIFIQAASSYSGTGVTDTINVPITLGTGYGLWLGNWTPTSANNLLSITGDITNSTNSAVATVGVGNVSISGNITNGGGSQSMYVDTAGGTTTLSGNNTYSGATTIENGTLALDYTTNNTSKIAGSAPLVFGEPDGGAGTLQLLGNNTAVTTQAASGLILNGAGTINLVAGTGQSVTLSAGGITRNAGGTLDVELTPGSGTTTLNTTTANDSTGILGSYATFGKTDWASSASNGVTPGAVSAYTGYVSDAWAAGDNTTVTGNDVIVADSTTNSLRFGDTLNTSGDTVTLSGTNTLTSGGILVSENVAGPSTITGGTLTTGAGTDLIVNQFGSSPLTIASNIMGVHGLTKSGSGTLVLSGSNNFNNQTIYLDQGTLQAGSGTALSTFLGNSTETVLMGGSSVLDLHGNNVGVGVISSDSAYGLAGGVAASAGQNANITNSAPGTFSTLTVEGSTASNYFGGFTEASGAILGLQVVGTGVFNMGGTNDVDAFDNSGNQYNGQTTWNDTFTGSVIVGQGSTLNVQGDGALRTWGAFTLDGALVGGVSNGRDIVSFASTYVNGTIAGSVTEAGSGSTSAYGSNWLNLNPLGTATDTYAGTWDRVTPILNGTGTVSLPSLTNALTNVSNMLIGSTGTLITPSDNITSELIITGSGTLKITGNDTSGYPLPSSLYNLQGGTLWLAPSGNSGSPVSISDPFNIYSSMQYQGTTILLDRGSNAGLVFSEGQPLVRENAGTMVIGATDGLAGLGVTEQFNLTYNNQPVLFGNGAVWNTPANTNGIVAPYFVGQDDSVGSTKQGSFLSYVGSGESPSDTGFVAYSYSGSNNLTSSISSSVELVTSAGSPQSLTADTSAYALQVDGAGTAGSPVASVVALNAHTLNLGSGGLILNGGTLSGGTLTSSSGEFDVYTSLLNGAVSSNLTGGSSLVKFGPGVLTLSGFNSYTGSTNINNGALDVGTINGDTGLALPAGVINFNGGVLQGNGAFTRSIGGGAGQVNFLSGGVTTAGGGFAARGGSLTVTIGGIANPTQLGWGQTYNSFIADGGVLYFGSATADSAVTLTNNLDLGLVASNSDLPVFANSQQTPATGYLDRVISVQANINDTSGVVNGPLTIDPFAAADVAILSGVISSSDPYHVLSKDGNGVLELTGQNTYTGATGIANGVLIVSSDANLGVAPTSAYVLNTSIATSGAAATPGAVIINSSATLATNTSFTLSDTRTILLASGIGGAANASNIDVTGTGTTLTFGGQISNYIGEVGALNKTGSGIFVFSGTGSYTGATVVSGGTFDLQGTLNNSSPTSASLSNIGTSLTFQNTGGTFNYDYADSHSTGLTPTTYLQNMGALTLNGGEATVMSTLGGTGIINGSSVALSFTSLTANTANGATLNFVTDGTVVASTGFASATNNEIQIAGQAIDTNDFLSRGALGQGSFIGQTYSDPSSNANVFFNGSDYAYYDTQGYVRGIAFGTGGAFGHGDPDTVTTSTTAFDNVTSTDNYGDTLDQYGYVQVTGAVTGQGAASITGLEMTGGTASIAQTPGTTLQTNGILVSGGGPATITGGSITTSYGNSLVVRTDLSTDSLEMDSTIIDNSSLGSIALTKSGAGTLILNAANTYSGGTAISNGTVQVGNGGMTGTLGSGAVLDNATLAFNRSDVSTVGNAISGIGGVNQIGTGTTDLTAAETYMGATAVQNGTLQIGGTGSLSASTSVILGSGTASGVLALGDGSGPANVTVASVTTSGTGLGNAVVGGNSSISNLTIDNTTTDTYSGALGGAGLDQNNLSLTKTGEGILILNGTSTNSGGTTIDAGTLSVQSTGALGTTGPISFGGGELQFSSANTVDYSSRIANSTAPILIDTNGQNVTFAGTIDSTNTGGLGKVGAGTLTLSGTNSFTGLDSILEGTVAINSAAALGNSTAISIGNTANPTGTATLQYTGGNGSLGLTIQTAPGDVGTISNTGGATLTLSGAVNILDSTLTLNSTLGSTINVGGVISGNDGTPDSNLMITGGGEVILTNASNSYFGTTTVNGGTLAITAGNGSTLGSSTLLLENQGALAFSGPGTGGFPNFNFSNTINLGTGGGAVVIGGEDDIFGSIIGPTSSLSISGSGDFLYSGGPSDVGTINLTGARLLMFGNTLNILANNATVNVAATGNLDFGATNATVTNAINLASGADLETRNGNLTFTNVTLPTTGIVTLGSDDVGGGSLVFDGNALNLTGDLTLAIGGRNGGNQTPVVLQMTISGNGGLIDTNGTSGNATAISPLYITGTNTYSGATTVTNGGFVDFAGNETGIGSALNVQNGSLQIGSTGSIASTAIITLGDNAGDSGQLILGDGSGAANITIGTGSIVTSGSGNDEVVGGSGAISNLTYNVTGTANATFGVRLGDFQNGVQNNVSLTKTGSGTLNVTNGNNSYTGGTIISGGTLAITQDSQLGNNDSSTVTLLNNSTLLFNAGMNFNHTIVLGSGGGTLNGVSDEFLGSTITGGTGLTIAGGDILTVGGAVDNVGSLTITGGRLLNLSLSLFGNNASVLNESVLDFGVGGSPTLTNSMAFTSGSALEQRGHTNLTLTNATLPSGGTFTIGADDVSDSGSFALGNTSGTLATLTSDLTIVTNNANNAVFFTSPITGNGSLILDGTGPLILTSANSYTGTTQVQSGTLEVSSTGNLPSSSTVILGNGNTNGTLALGDGSNGANVTVGGLTDASNNPNGDSVINNGSAGGSTLTFSPSGTSSFTYNGVIGGGGNQNLVTIIKTGTGTQILTDGNSNYTGGTSIEAGTLGITTDGAVGNTDTGAVTITNGAVLQFQNNLNFSHAIVLGTGGGEINGLGHDVGTLGQFTGGDLTIIGGDILAQEDAGHANDIGTITVTNGGTRLLLFTSNFIANNAIIDVTNSGNFDFGMGGSPSFANSINLASGTALTDRGTDVTLTNFTAPSDGANPTFTIGSDDVGGGSITIANGIALTNNLNLNVNINNGGGATGVTVQSNITGTGNLSLSSAYGNNLQDGAATFSAANSYQGTTTVNSGTMLLKGDNTGVTSIGGGAPTYVISTTAPVLNGSGPSYLPAGAGFLQIGSGGSIASDSNIVLGSAQGFAFLVLGDGGGAVNQTVGSLNIASGAGDNASIIGGNSSTSYLTVNVAANTTNTYNGLFGNTNGNFSSPYNDNLGLVFNIGSGATMVLGGFTGDNIAGGFVINGGTLAVSGGALGGQGENVTLNNATLQLRNNGYGGGGPTDNFILGTGTNSIMGNDGIDNFSGDVTSGAGSVLHVSGSNLVVTPNSTPSDIGTLDIDSGRTFLMGSNGLNLIANNAAVNVASSATLDFATSTTFTATNAITFATGSALTMRNNGTNVTLTNALLPTAGTFLIGGDDVGTAGSYTITNGQALTGDLDLTVNQASVPVTLSGNISGTGGLRQDAGAQGAGNLTLSGTNSYSGATILAAGTLNITGDNSETGKDYNIIGGTINLAHSGSLPSAAIITEGGGSSSGTLVMGDTNGASDVTAASLNTSGTGNANSIVGGSGTVSTLTVANATTNTYAGTIGGGGTDQNNLALVKSGVGNLILSGVNTYNGGTTIQSGTLSINGSIAGGTIVDLGANIGGHGSIAGIISGEGAVGPGNSPGILTASQVDPSGGLSFNLEFTQQGQPTFSNAAASGNDVLHLESGTPFVSALTSSNAVNLYFSGVGTFAGGFFVDGATDDLTANIADATYTAYILDNTSGTFLYNGNEYDLISAGDDTFSMSILGEIGANFADGNVNGYDEKFVIAGPPAAVPEPSTWAMLLAGLGLLAFLGYRRSRASA